MSEVDLRHSVSDSGDGCGGIFSLKTSAGLCAKCQKLATLELDSPEYSRWKNICQCSSCGVAWRNMTDETCGRCTRILAGSDNAMKNFRLFSIFKAFITHLSRGRGIGS